MRSRTDAAARGTSWALPVGLSGGRAVTTAAAEGDEAAKLAAVVSAQEELATATSVRDAAAQLAFDGIVCAGLTGQTRAACNHARKVALDTLTAANADVSERSAEVDAAQLVLEQMAADLSAAAAVTTEAKLAVEQAEAERAAAAAELATAERDAARVAVDTYVPPTNDEHPGCNGVHNAQARVAKTSQSKGNAAVTLAGVAGKLGCSAHGRWR